MNIPENIISKIMLYNSHPVADLIRELQYEYNELEKLRLEYPDCDVIPFASMCFSLALYKKNIRKMLST
jgi:hypothetical protein